MRKRRWLPVEIALSLFCLILAGSLAAQERPAADKAEPAVAKDEPLSSSQEMISRRYKRFEETLLKIYESLKKTDPDRAGLLLRVIGKSTEERISTQMIDLVQLLKDNQQLGDAIERQGDLVTQLQVLLDLLLSEDRQKELKEQQARIRRYLEELNKIIAKEKGARADNERGAPADDVAGTQQKIADQVGKLDKTIGKEDRDRQAQGQPGAGEPKESPDGQGADGDQKEGQNGKGESQPGDKGKPGEKGSPGEKKDPQNDKDSQKRGPRSDTDKPERDKPGDKSDGDQSESDRSQGDQSKSGQPKDGQSGKGDQQKGQPGEGQPQEGQPQKGQPSDGQQGEPQDGQQQAGKSQNQDQTPGREELEKARRAMERAIDKLKQKQRNEASDEQDEALANLQKAKEKLEEILRQLREEERDRFLAKLEARFQQMLAMQLLVYDGTLKLAKTPDDDRSGRHTTRSVQLAREEDAIATEANKAIMLLREEGTAVAFPEALEQVRDDMRLVVLRLERTDVGELTQTVEREIIDALEEMIEALQKEMEKNKDKKEQQQQQQQDAAQQGEPPLVDQLAELKMLRTLQLRVNRRTRTLGHLVEGEQAQAADLVSQLQNLADRQARIQRATHDLVTGKNK